MTTKQTNVRLPPYARRQFAELVETHGVNASTVMILAIDRMHSQTIGPHAEAEPMVSHYAAQEASAVAEFDPTA